MLKKTCLALCLALVLALGCISAGAETAAPTSDSPLVYVNGEAITYGDLMPLYQSYYQQYQSYGLDLSDEASQQSLLNMAVNSLIQDKVLRQKAAELGLDQFTQEEEDFLRGQVEGGYNDLVESYVMYSSDPEKSEEENRQAARDLLAQMGYTVEALMASEKDAEIFQRLYDYTTEGVSIPDAAVQTAYEEGLAQAKENYAQDPNAYIRAATTDELVLYVPAGHRAVKHILVTFDTAAELKELQAQLAGLSQEDEAYAAAQARIQEIMAEVQPKLDEIAQKIQAGEDFQALIDTYGEDGGMKSGPTAEKGYYVCEGTSAYVPEFYEASMALEKVGDISQPVLTDYGYHIIRYHADVEEAVIPFEEVQARLKDQLLNEALSAAYSGKANEWANAAQIEFVPQAIAE